MRGPVPPHEMVPPKGPPPRVRRVNADLRVGFGVLLFMAWGVETVLWVASTVHAVGNGHPMSAVTAALALVLLVVLCLMEGLEVSVIDRWEKLWPDRTTSYLAGWLSARQLFVALIVTTATLLANRSVIVIPGSSYQITGSVATGAFDTTWTGLTVLWFAQIFPKHLGATNPDRYLKRTRRTLFPVVAFVHRIGVSQPGEWMAVAVENRLNWTASPEELKRHEPRHQLSLGAIWRELRKPH
jgi:hypothetical protein